MEKSLSSSHNRYLHNFRCPGQNGSRDSAWGSNPSTGGKSPPGLHPQVRPGGPREGDRGRLHRRRAGSARCRAGQPGRLDCTVWGVHPHQRRQTQWHRGHRNRRRVPRTNRSLELDYPIFSSGRYMRTGNGPGPGRRRQTATSTSPPSGSARRHRRGRRRRSRRHSKGVRGESPGHRSRDRGRREKIRSATEQGMRLDEARSSSSTTRSDRA